MHWQLINATAAYLSSNVDKQDFAFFETVLRGTKEMKPRWKRALDKTDGSLGEPLGKLFVEKYFSADAKAKVNTLVDNLTLAYRERIKTLDWMSEPTKKQALTKLDKIIRKLGYPDKWKDHSKMEISDDSYCMNVLRSNAFGYKEMLDKVGKPERGKCTYLHLTDHQFLKLATFDFRNCSRNIGQADRSCGRHLPRLDR